MVIPRIGMLSVGVQYESTEPEIASAAQSGDHHAVDERIAPATSEECHVPFDMPFHGGAPAVERRLRRAASA